MKLKHFLRLPVTCHSPSTHNGAVCYTSLSLPAQQSISERPLLSQPQYVIMLKAMKCCAIPEYSQQITLPISVVAVKKEKKIAFNVRKRKPSSLSSKQWNPKSHCKVFSSLLSNPQGAREHPADTSATNWQELSSFSWLKATGNALQGSIQREEPLLPSLFGDNVIKHHLPPPKRSPIQLFSRCPTSYLILNFGLIALGISFSLRGETRAVPTGLRGGEHHTGPPRRRGALPPGGTLSPQRGAGGAGGSARPGGSAAAPPSPPSGGPLRGGPAPAHGRRFWRQSGGGGARAEGARPLPALSARRRAGASRPLPPHPALPPKAAGSDRSAPRPAPPGR